MTAIVFAGPTLTRAEIRDLADVDCRPPAAQGDVYKATLEKPKCIGIIDGYFNGVPSIWHKEILWAMNQGIAVFGSASMGALRAAELYDFGMIGVGSVFEDFKSGVLEDDDEVAVIHAPAELGFKPLSEPMVNIRATLARAVKDGVLNETAATAVRDQAKSLFYQERDWAMILKNLPLDLIDDKQNSDFSTWVSENRVDIKRADAISMISAMDTLIRNGEAAPETSFNFEQTHLWKNLVEQADAPVRQASYEQEDEFVLDELRLDHKLFQDVSSAAINRSLALKHLEGEPVTVERKRLRDRISEHMQTHGLTTRKALVKWVNKNGMDVAEFENLLAEDCMAENAQSVSGELLAIHGMQILKRDGIYAGLAKRARTKRKSLKTTEGDTAVIDSTGLTPPELMAWFFNVHCKIPYPRDLDVYIRELGLDDRQRFYAIVARQYLYVQKVGGA